MYSGKQDVFLALSQIQIKLMGGTNVYRRERLILEIYFVIRRSQGSFCSVSFLIYFILLYFNLWHSNQNLIEGKHILFGPESEH